MAARSMTPYRQKFLEKSKEEQEKILKKIGFGDLFDSVESAEEEYFAIKTGEKEMQVDSDGLLLDPFCICKVPDTEKYCIVPHRVKKNQKTGEYEFVPHDGVWTSEALCFECVKDASVIKRDYLHRCKRVSGLYGPWKIETW